MVIVIPLDFPGGSVLKNPPANIGDMGSIPGLGKSPGGENGNPFQCSCLGNLLDRGAWWVTAHGVTKSWTRLSTHVARIVISLEAKDYHSLWKHNSCVEPSPFCKYIAHWLLFSE